MGEPMKRLKLYLDTSVPSGFYDARKPDRREETRKFWRTIDSYETIISVLVEEELS